MTVYARNDVCAVSISKDHGGCGETHSRPVVNGAPAKFWGLTCAGGCEDHLRGTSLWATTRETIPETPDETNIRTEAERRGQIDLNTQVKDALVMIARGFNSGGPTQQTVELVKCGSGHENLSAAKFCAECGANMKQSEPEGKSTPEAAPEQVESSADPGVDLANLDPETTKLAELKEIAQQVGAPTARSKAEQISLIQQAVQQNDE